MAVLLKQIGSDPINYSWQIVIEFMKNVGNFPASVCVAKAADCLPRRLLQLHEKSTCKLLRLRFGNFHFMLSSTNSLISLKGNRILLCFASKLSK